jgi:hypothetical protein
MKAVLLAAVAVAQVALAGQSVAATCAESSVVQARLGAKFGERLAYTGQARENHAVLVYASQKTGRWTMLVETPDGLACLVATGRGESSLSERMGQQLNVVFR